MCLWWWQCWPIGLICQPAAMASVWLWSDIALNYKALWETWKALYKFCVKCILYTTETWHLILPKCLWSLYCLVPELFSCAVCKVLGLDYISERGIKRKSVWVLRWYRAVILKITWLQKPKVLKQNMVNKKIKSLRTTKVNTLHIQYSSILPWEPCLSGCLCTH